VDSHLFILALFVVIISEIWQFCNKKEDVVLYSPGFQKYTRPSILPKIRYEVYRRDGFRCRHCGSPYNLVIDHITPRSWGGPDHISNYQTLCDQCNKIKGNRFAG